MIVDWDAWMKKRHIKIMTEEERLQYEAAKAEREEKERKRKVVEQWRQ